MTFSVEFTAVQSDAVQIVADERIAIPDCVRSFLNTALFAFKPESLVYVKAYGHLYNKDYQTSNADIKVYEVTLKKP